MSHCCNKSVVSDSNYGGGNTMAGLIIFILVILQFQKRKCHEEEGRNDQLFDNSVLFILVLFIIACCGKVKLGC